MFLRSPSNDARAIASSSSVHRTPWTSRFQNGDYIVNHVYGKVHLLPVDYQRRREPYRGFSGSLDHQPPVEALDHDLVAQLRPGLYSFAVVGDLDSDHQPKSAHIGDQLMLRLQLAQSVDHISAHLGGVLH